ncbi:MAG: ATP-binding protein [Vulcanibacillus sp.]
MELAVLSGKGGTGKTTIAISLSELSDNVVTVDCDVDAPNLYLYYQGNELKKENFSCSKKAVIDKDICLYCGKCQQACNFDAIDDNMNINPYKCEGCGMCVLVCKQNAIKLVDEDSAILFVNETRNGIISRAEMAIGADGSGKIVTKIRNNAKGILEDSRLTIIDGSPGLGCSVIASVTGCDLALIVTEPTKSGLEDLKRIIKLTKHFQTNTLVCVNKYDINPEITEVITNYCISENIQVVGRIPFDEMVRKSINELKPIINYQDSTANHAIREMWENIKEYSNKKFRGTK